MDFELQRPDHIQEEPWAAIQQHRLRLELAWRSSDRPAVVGAAKELIESVAGAVLVATEQTIGDRADYSDRVNAAHKALARQAGQDVSQSPEIRSIAQSARTIADGATTTNDDSRTIVRRIDARPRSSSASAEHAGADNLPWEWMGVWQGKLRGFAMGRVGIW